MGRTPIERVVLPVRSRDELPPVLAGLQWIFQTRELNGQIFEWLEKKVVGDKEATGRPGWDLWHILVLGSVRLALDGDYDRLEYLANDDSLLRQILGLNPTRSDSEKPFHYQTLSENVCPVEEELLQPIKALVVQAGRGAFKKRKAVSLMIKQLDWVERRLLGGETIPHEEKSFSLFEPHTQGIAKGKLFPPVERGHKVVLTTDPHGLILDDKVRDQLNDADEVIALADRLLGPYGSTGVASLSFDKGFSRKQARQLLELYIPQGILPKRGKRNRQEHAREQQRRFAVLPRQHNAIESDSNCLEHHGLNRCPDKGYPGFKRYTGFGVLAYNLHKIGQRLLTRRPPAEPPRVFCA